MPQIKFEDGAVEIDAAVIAQKLGIEPGLMHAQMQKGKIASLCERGAADDAGTFRLKV